MKKFLFITSIAAALSLGFFASSAHAQDASSSVSASNGTSSATSTVANPCDTDQQAANLKAAQKATAAGDIETAISLKKTVLKNVLLCSSQETQDLKTAVNSIQTDDQDAMAVKSATLRRLDDTFAYYDSNIKTVDGITKLKSVQDLSKKVLNERATTYEPFMQSVLNFVIWNGNQKIFKSAEVRLNQISQTMNALKLVDNGDFQNLYQDATDNFNAAKADNDEARTLVLTMAPAGDSSPVIKQSLDELSAVYKDFMSLSDKIGKALPQ